MWEKIELNPKNPQIIIQIGKTRGTKYILNAEVEFVGESPIIKQRKEASQIFEIPLPDGQIIKIQGKIRAQILENLLQTSNENPAEAEKLAKLVYGSSTRRDLTNLQHIIGRLGKNLQSVSYQIIQTVSKAEQSKGKKGKYYLEKIEREEKLKYPYFPVFPDHIKALNYILENPEEGNVAEVIEILGPIKDQPYTTSQAAFALKRASALAFTRREVEKAEQRPILTEEERELIEKIEAFVGLQGINARRAFKQVIDNFFATKKKPINEILQAFAEKPELELPSIEEIALLVTLIRLRQDIVKKYGLPVISRELADRIILRIENPQNYDTETLTQLRQKTYEKIAKLITSDEFDQIFLQVDDEALQELILELVTSDPERQEAQLAALEEALLSPIDTHWIEQAGQVLKYWRELKTPPKADFEAKPKISQQPKLEKAEREVSLSKEDRQFLNRALGQLFEHNIRRPINAAQVTKVFPKLKMTVLKRMAEKKYVSPEIDKNGHPRYSLVDILIMLYISKNGNNIAPRKLRELKRLISSWLDKKSQSS